MSSRTLQLAKATETDPRWTAILTRDANADGQFYYSVKTTGVYCRPSCASRTARPENIQFYETRKDAEKAGFRPCKRCKPEQTPLLEKHAATVTKVCRLIEKSEKLPSLGELAEYAELSPWYFHRVFKTITGLTPKAYATAHQSKRIRNELKKSDTVTRAIFNAGLNSSGRFYEKANQVLGMTPSNYRAGGTNTDIYFAIGECSLGSILVASSDRGICAIFLGDDPEALLKDLQDKFPESNFIGGDTKFEKQVAQVVGLVESPGAGLNLPLDIRGTVFQQRVWQALKNIPVGSTASYSDIAKQIGSPKSFRAVAQACAANTLAVAIPCHRVVRNDGSLSGYRWGIERKRVLLEKEKQ